MPISDVLRLSHFSVSGLFNEFNHNILFNEGERITALIGPNGLGKTVCLKLIDALFRRKWILFSSTQFNEVVFTFSDGSLITVRHLTPEDIKTEVRSNIGVVFITERPNLSEPVKWSPRLSEERSIQLGRIENHLPFLSRTGAKTWSHDMTGQSFSFQEVLENYSDKLPAAFVADSSASMPIELASIISSIDCHLIETQRLLVLSPDEYRRGIISNLAISQKAKALSDIITGELKRYAAVSQSLDRSFPKRVLSRGVNLPPEDLTANLTDLDKLRTDLTDAGILEQEADDAIPPIQHIDPGIAAVLSVYVADTRQKLQVLSQLRLRILLFIELINQRFYPKIVDVNKDSGFIVKRSDKIDVPLDKLSSGEQHQLVLFFELLFELKSNALILIDEPELSLHVAWQRQFIPDLKRIIDLNKFDVLLATHSPQLIGEWESLVVELGDVDAA